VLPARAFARIGRRAAKKDRVRVAHRDDRPKSRRPIAAADAMHLVEPHLHAIGFGMVRHGPFGRKQRQLTMMSAVFVEGLDDPTPGVALAIVDLTKIQHGTLHTLPPAQRLLSTMLQ